MADHRGMATKSAKSAREPRTGQVVQGRPLARFDAGVVLVQTPGARQPKPALRAEDGAAVLVPKAWRALKKPGISRQAVFPTSSTTVFAYSVDPADPTRIVREAADGTRTIGRLVNGRFQPSPCA
jgi:hypothetical protein